jgi:cobalt-zinc-cadmium resistance protein CzcA
MFMNRHILIFLIITRALFHCEWGVAQLLSLEEAILLAEKNNAGLKASELRTRQQKFLMRASAEIPKTDINLLYGKYNSINNDNNITITQSFPFPVTTLRQIHLAQAQFDLASRQYAYQKQQLLTEVKSVFYTLLYLREIIRLRTIADSLMRGLAHTAEVRFRSGEGTWLEKNAADLQLREAQMQLLQTRTEYLSYLNQLSVLVNEDFSDIIGNLHVRVMSLPDSLDVSLNPAWQNEASRYQMARSTTRLEQSRLWPDLRIAYFNQTIIGVQNINGADIYFGPGTRFEGLEAGLVFPLWLAPQVNKIKAARMAEQAAAEDLQYTTRQISHRWQQLKREIQTHLEMLRYYEDQAIPAADRMLEQAQRAFSLGEMNYTMTLLNARQALITREGYAQTRNKLNQLIIELEFLSGYVHENQ